MTVDIAELARATGDASVAGSNRPLTTNIGSIAREAPIIGAETTCGEVAESFNRQRDLAAIVIKLGEGRYGLAERNNYLHRYLDGFRRDLFQRKPILLLMEVNPAIVDWDMPVGEAGVLLSSQTGDPVRSAFIITRAGTVAGVGLANDLMRRIARVAQEQLVQLGQVHAELEQRVSDRTADLARAQEAAEKANMAKSEFLASMSHEIRTPLNSVIGNIELLSHTSPTLEQRDLIDSADKAAKSLLALVGNILDFSKIEAGKLTLEMGEINPAAIVEEAVDVLQSNARQKGTFIAVLADPMVPMTVRGDGKRLRQILLNLIGNAVKFTEIGGIQVCLSAHDRGQNECELRCEVHDSGVGFEPSLAATLFDAFVQRSRTTETAEGTGLGLSICRSLVEALGGAIGCEATPTDGATFWFTIPAAVIRRAEPVRRPVLTDRTVLTIGAPMPEGEWLENYFQERGAALVRAPDLASASPILERAATGQQPPAAAILLPSRAYDSDLPGTVRRLRQMNVVPMAILSDEILASRRKALRSGIGATILLRPGASEVDRARYLDWNIASLVGNASEHSKRVGVRSIESAYGPIEKGKRVLVLEDRLVNQMVIQKQLKKLAVDCVLASNGVKGLETLERERFDLILCDCSMPVMNGFDFTREIRRREVSSRDNRRIPVIAVTANAFREDADKCFESGMDDFISKPVTLDRMAEVLAKWLHPVEPPPPVTKPAGDSDGGNLPALDMNALIDILGGNDQEMIADVLRSFVLAARESLINVQAAFATNDAGGIRAATHGAKGEARFAAALHLGNLYAEMEKRTKAGDVSGAAALVARAAAEVERVDAFVHDFLSKEQTRTAIS